MIHVYICFDDMCLSCCEYFLISMHAHGHIYIYMCVCMYKCKLYLCMYTGQNLKTSEHVFCLFWMLTRLGRFYSSTFLVFAPFPTRILAFEATVCLPVLRGSKLSQTWWAWVTAVHGLWGGCSPQIDVSCIQLAVFLFCTLGDLYWSGFQRAFMIRKIGKLGFWQMLQTGKRCMATHRSATYQASVHGEARKEFWTAFSLTFFQWAVDPCGEWGEHTMSTIYSCISIRIELRLFQFHFVGGSGIYPDLLHIVDLQILHDVIASTLLDITDATDRARPREVQLKELCQQYQRWCQEMRSMASTVEMQHSKSFDFFPHGKTWRRGTKLK